jgi:hypothetical protein
MFPNHFSYEVSELMWRTHPLLPLVRGQELGHSFLGKWTREHIPVMEHGKQAVGSVRGRGQKVGINRHD